ncbi:MAG TPA: beta-ketoacyl synthase N-terminal-like domain-containing protein [Thermoanaerobaculia bacterium]
MNGRVVITGMGVVAPNGIGKDQFWANSLAGTSGVREIDRFDTRTYGCRIAGQVEDFRATDFVERNIVKQTDRSTHMALAACSMATADAGLDLGAEDPEQVGMYFANVFGGMEFAERELYAQHRIGPDRVSAYQAIAWFFAATQGQWSIWKGLKGFGKSIVADRVGGHQALLLGALAIRQGHAKVIYAGGFEAPVVPYVFRIHETSRLLSSALGKPEQAYRPFDAERTGLVLGEGSGVVILEDAEHAEARGARVYAELAGGAITCDGRSGDEEHLARCLSEAVTSSGLRAEDVDHVIAEGIGVREHDFREAAAIARVFGGHETTVSVPKARTGHTLAAGGALDAIWAALMLSEDRLLAPVNLSQPDTGVPLKLDAHRRARLGAVVCCGSGFGGVNTAIVLRRSAEEGQ